MKEQISTNHAIGCFSFDDLKQYKNIFVKLPQELKDIDNLFYTRDDVTINLINEDFTSLKSATETNYYNNVLKVINQLSNHNRKYNIKIEVDNRELFKKSNIINVIPSNINLIINTNLKGESTHVEYDTDTYIKEEIKVENLIKPIRDSNLSSFEKYIACYNLAKNFKAYRENNEDRKKARELRYILDDDNKYIVCVGFSNLLSLFLDKVGIPNTQIDVEVDISYNYSDLLDNIPIKNEGHRRNLVKIDDDKYNIHGYYIADSTWDNKLGLDYYNNAVLTFEEKKEAHSLESLTEIDLFFDFNNFEDFSNKINYFLRTNISIDVQFNKKEEDAIIYAYKALYRKILGILYYTDQKKYFEFYNKYKTIVDSHMNLKEMEPIVYNFLNEYASYIIPLSNNKISMNKILDAACVVKKEISGYSDEEITDWLESVKIINRRRRQQAFPYNAKLNDNIQARSEDLLEEIKKR